MTGRVNSENIERLMKDEGQREIFHYWNEKRGDALAPDMRSIRPEELGHHFSKVSILTWTPPAQLTVRLIAALLVKDGVGDLTGANMLDAVGQKTRSDFARALEAQFAVPSIGVTRQRVFYRDNSYTEYITTSFPIADSDGTVKYLLAYTFAVSELEGGGT